MRKFLELFFNTLIVMITIACVPAIILGAVFLTNQGQYFAIPCGIILLAALIAGFICFTD